MGKEHNILESEIMKIGSSYDSITTKVTYSLYLHTVDRDIPIQWLESLEVMRDYSGNIGDLTSVRFKMGMGEYLRDVHNYRNNLELTVIYKNQNRTVSQRYKFIITNNIKGIDGSSITSISYEEADKGSIINIEGQFVNRVLEALRAIPVDGIHHNSKVDNILKTILLKGCRSLIVDNNQLEINIDMYPASNPNIIKRLTIPTGTMLTELPFYLQDVKPGIYNTGIGFYVQEFGEKLLDTLFVYPLYNTKRFDNEIKKCIIYNSSVSKYDFLENTYFRDGDILKLFTTSDSEFINDHENSQINEGNALIVKNTKNMITKKVVINEDSIISSKDINLTGSQLYKREDSLNIPRFHNDNESLYKVRSNIARKEVTYLTTQWNFCNPELIYPGMPVTYIYINNKGKMIRLTGIISGLYFKYINGVKEQHSVLSLILNKPDKAVEDKSDIRG